MSTTLKLMNYAPHILTAKINLTDIPKGSRLVYVSDTDDYVTYQKGSKVFVLGLEDATKGEYFEMAETGSQPVQPTEPIPVRLFAHNRGTGITMGVLALLAVLMDISGVFASQYPIGVITIGMLISVSYWLGFSTLIRKIAKRQLNRWETGFTAFGLFVLYFVVCAAFAPDPSKVHLGMIDYVGFYAAIRAMRLTND